MTAFTDMLKADAAALCSAEFSESLTYTKPAGTTRAISGVVNRQTPENYQGVVGPLAEIVVPNSATVGISSAELDLGGDTITLALTIGKPAETFNIHRPNDGQAWQDAGMLRLWLR